MGRILALIHAPRSVVAANVANPLAVGYAKEDDRVRPSRKWYLQPEPLPIILAILAHPSTRVTRATMG